MSRTSTHGVQNAELLGKALLSLESNPVGLDSYVFADVSGATQATVWRAFGADAGPDLALRLTPKPQELVDRIAELVNGVAGVECPRTLATSTLDDGDQSWTVQLCTWIGVGAPAQPDMRRLGEQLASLHAAMADTTVDVTDRPLSFDPVLRPPADADPPSWYVAYHLWRRQIFAWLDVQAPRMLPQPIHGDMHWGNVVATDDGSFGFIDFDKVMYAPAIFDLAKLIATGMFQSGKKARFQLAKAQALVEGYQSVRRLSDDELQALEGLALLLNVQTARIGTLHGVEDYQRAADAIGCWWINRRRRSRIDPFGLRPASEPILTATSERVIQLALWPGDPNQLTLWD